MSNVVNGIKYTVQDINNLSLDKLSGMPLNELRGITVILGSAVNKRLKSFKDVETPATISLNQSGGKISVKGLTEKEDILNELKRAKKFFNQKTSTKKGYEEVKQDFEERTGIDFGDKEKNNKFWHTYNKINEQGKVTGQIMDSDQLQKMMKKIMLNSRKNIAEKTFYEKVNTELTKQYEKEQESWLMKNDGTGNKSTSNFFDIGSND